MSSPDIETYSHCHILLLESLARVAVASSPTSSIAFSTLPAGVASTAWSVLVPMPFLDCLDRGAPQALLLLAHWGVLMSRVTGVYWVEGFGESVVKAVMLEFARRDEEDKVLGSSGNSGFDWRKWMEWPMRMVGGRL